MRDPHADKFVRVAERLARPALAPLVDELARRYGEGAGIEPTRVTLRDLTTENRRALADLLGLDRLPPKTLRLPVSRVRDALSMSEPSLRPVLESLRGPLGDRRSAIAQDQAARAALWSWLADTVTGIDLGSGQGLNEWVALVRAAGVRGGLDATRARLAAAAAVLRALPADGVPLAAFAADHAGGPHELDNGRALAAVVLDAVAVGTAQPRAADAESTRALWESVGVVPDPLSSSVLTLGLQGAGASPLDRWLSTAAANAEPLVLTLANLRRWPVQSLPAVACLFVVENPSLVAAAADLRWAGPPIVCSAGRPSLAVVTLLRQLTASGAAAYQHADFDPAGLSITAWLAERAGTIPWRMGAADYGLYADDGAPLAGPVPDTPWDPALREAMESHRRVVYEEQLRSQLVAAMQAPG